ncbi:MAG: FAD-dependent oxidoreductase [Sulfurovum sp.]|nr:FAD-dependent oxidoreductase [Sulfurovum sp.]
MNDHNTVSTDVLIVGGGPGGLSMAIELANRLREKGVEKKIMLIEKGSEIGSHILSGAVIRPKVFRDLLSEDEYDKFPFDSRVEGDDVVMKLSANTVTKLPFHPPYMSNEGNYIASLGQICKYLAEIAQDKGVEIYTGFSVDEMMYENGKIVGIKTKDTGVDRHGVKQKNYQQGTMVEASITVLAEGSRGSLIQKMIDRHDLEGENHQIYSLGVKELWSVPEGSIKSGAVYHTFGYPLNDKEEFGGGFIYGLSDNRVALGLVVGLDYKDPSFDIHAAMQIWKSHPEISKFIDGGKILEFGAKTLPEGGWYSIPKYYDDNLMIVGDSAGFLSTPRLKGVHLAVRSGICAAQAAVEALISEDTSEKSLARYEELVNDSFIYKELYPTRNMRAVMHDGMLIGGFKIGMQLLTGGSCLLRVPHMKEDCNTTQRVALFKRLPFAERFKGKLEFDGALTFDKVTSVYHSKTAHDEMQPSHLVVKDSVQFQRSNIEKYGLPEASFCPAEVYELHVGKGDKRSLRLHPENCVHCKTCDIKSPNCGIEWTVPYGGNGPEYTYM